MKFKIPASFKSPEYKQANANKHDLARSCVQYLPVMIRPVMTRPIMTLAVVSLAVMALVLVSLLGCTSSTTFDPSPKQSTSVSTCQGVCAAFDIGSESTKLRVYDYSQKKLVPVEQVGTQVCRHELKVSYAQDVAATNQISPATLKTGAQRLQELKKIALACGAKQLAGLVTSAFRKAQNGEAALTQLQNELGFPIHLVSQAEEAQLAYYGVRAVLGLAEPNFCVWDVGGMSMQIICPLAPPAHGLTTGNTSHPLHTNPYPTHNSPNQNLPDQSSSAQNEFAQENSKKTHINPSSSASRTSASRDQTQTARIKFVTYLGQLASVPFKNQILKIQNKKQNQSPNPISKADYDKAYKSTWYEAQKIKNHLGAPWSARFAQNLAQVQPIKTHTQGSSKLSSPSFTDKTNFQNRVYASPYLLQNLPMPLIGVGNVHKYIGLNAFKQNKVLKLSELNKVVEKFLGQGDNNLPGGNYVSVTVSNLMLVQQLMQQLDIQELPLADVNLTQGLIASPGYW